MVVFYRSLSVYIFGGPNVEIWANIKASIKVRTLAKGEIRAQKTANIGTWVPLLSVKTLPTLRQMQSLAIWARWIDAEGKLFLFFQISWPTC